MKKLFAFVAAALVSIATFASREVVPSDADLASYATKTYTMCIYNEGACNDIVLNGNYINGPGVSWPNGPSHDEMVTFQTVTGFDGWYVATWEVPEGTAEADGGVQAKPIQLDGSGSFNWDYQLGPDAELIRGTADLLSANNGTEVDIKNIGAGIVVIDVKSWKNNPCTAIYHMYKVTLVSPDCNDEDFITPAISGGFNGWAQEAMTLNELKTAERQNANLPGGVFEISFKAAEGSEFKFRSAEEWGKDWSNELKEYVAEDDNWKAFNDGQNFKLGEETTLEFDLGDPKKYSWTNCEKPDPCDEETKHKVVVGVNAPAGVPEAGIEIIGYDGWDVGTVMERNAETGWYVAVLENILECSEFKLREAGSWDNEIVNAETGKGLDNIKFRNVWEDIDWKGEKCKSIELDYSAGYVWKANWSSVEDVVLTVKAQKVVVDGVMYIVRDNKLFNVQGAQIR